MHNLRDILNRARINQQDTLDREFEFGEALDDINATFLDLSPLLVNCAGLLIMFLARAHGAFVGAVRMATSGQVPETFMLLRGAVENSLYAIHIKRDPAATYRGKNWLSRHAGAREGSRTRQEFTIASVKESLRETSAELRQVCDALYGRCLDLGAHPNQRGHFATSVFTDLDNPEGPEFKAFLFSPNPKINRFALRSCVEVGIFTLRVFGHVFEERLQLTAMPARIGTLHHNLAVFCERKIREEPYGETPAG
jgi:hypothetical protein